MSAPSHEAGRNGRIVTFYSYKGGTGRSMAVANVAWILASQGRRVLVIDWDLEAPGLHRYFHPFLADPELASSPGIIDFLTAFVEGAHEANPEDGGGWFEAYTDLEPYMFSLDWAFPDGGTLDVVPAGQQGASYAARVTGFDWQGFYERLGGGVFLEAVKRELRCEYDWILVDSRTGISDTSGICTVQLPDDLVVCFTLNDQSMTGAAAVTRWAMAQRQRPDGTPGMRVFPVRTRVERAETKRLHAAKEAAALLFTPFLSHLAEPARTSYWGAVEVLYHPFYAYEEIIAPFGDPPQEPGTMLSAMEILTSYLSDGAVQRLGDLPEETRLRERDRFLRQPPPAAASKGDSEETETKASRTAVVRGPSNVVHPAGRDRWSYWAYLSYARHDDDVYLERFVSDLGREVSALAGLPPEQGIFFDRSLNLGDSWEDVTLHALRTSLTCVALYSPRYFRNEHCGREFNAFLRRSHQRSEPGPAGIVPVIWTRSGFDVPRAAAEVQYLSHGVSADYEHEGLHSLMRRSGRGSAYHRVVHQLATLVVELGYKTPLPIVELPPLDRIGNAFQDEGQPVHGGEPSVQVVYATAGRAAMQAVRQDVGAYGERAEDWCPFQNGAPLHELVERVASSERLFVQAVAFDAEVAERILAAERTGTPFVLFVDPWCLGNPANLKLLYGLDSRLPANAAVFVVWDATDETYLSRARLEAGVAMAFPTLESSRGRRFHARVDSEGALIRAFTGTIVSLNAELTALRQVFSDQAPAPESAF